MSVLVEEDLICSSTHLRCRLGSVKDVGLFIREKNKFIFNKVLVHQKAEAHFNIHNASSLPCDVVLSLTPLTGKVRTGGQGDGVPLKAV